MDIKYFNRHEQKVEREKVYGDAAVKWLYQTTSGRLMGRLVASPVVSHLYGELQSAGFSRRKVAPFVENFSIKMDDFLPGEGKEYLLETGGDVSDWYESFNEFFIRRFRPGVRNIEQRPELMPAFSEARYFGHEQIDDKITIPVKGADLRAQELVARNRWAKHFEGGPFLVARLCPVDYHRFHFPDNAKVLDRYPVHGALHSVNPIALKERSNIFISNKREVTILETENFGLLAYIEVGATCVGKIVQTYRGDQVERGQEKGYFLFGGSTVVLLGQPGLWKPHEEVLKHTSEGLEVYSKLGFPIAEKL